MPKSKPNHEVAQSKRRQLETFAHWLDTKFELPGVGVRFGLDAVLGLLPGIGDTASAVASIYILQSAANFGVPRITLVRMTLNILIDLILGSIPLLGDVFDVFWKANQKNVQLLKRQIDANDWTEKKLRRTDSLFVVLMIAVILLVLILSAAAAFYLVTHAIQVFAQ
jgi:hypothetical protein